jgi:hypothetical protein
VNAAFRSRRRRVTQFFGRRTAPAAQPGEKQGCEEFEVTGDFLNPVVLFFLEKSKGHQGLVTR